jgi:hypothetical protein
VGAHSRVELAGAETGVEVEFLAQLDVDRPETRPHGCGGRTLYPYLRPTDGFEGALREGITLGLVDIFAGGVFIPLELDTGRLENASGRLDQFGAGPVARDECDLVSHQRRWYPQRA